MEVVDGIVKRTRFCLCGAAITASGPWTEVERALAIWTEEHSADGHGPATQELAYAARMRQEQQEIEAVYERRDGDNATVVGA